MPLAVLGFQGRLVAGVGKALRLYDMGKKKLLRKVENKVRSFISVEGCVCLILVIGLLVGNCHSTDTRVPNHSRRHARIYLLCGVQASGKPTPHLCRRLTTSMDNIGYYGRL